jgi:hypothetical protein
LPTFFHYKTFNLPNLGFLFWKYTIWQPRTKSRSMSPRSTNMIKLCNFDLMEKKPFDFDSTKIRISFMCWLPFDRLIENVAYLDLLSFKVWKKRFNKLEAFFSFFNQFCMNGTYSKCDSKKFYFWEVVILKLDRRRIFGRVGISKTCTYACTTYVCMYVHI